MVATPLNTFFSTAVRSLQCHGFVIYRGKDIQERSLGHKALFVFVTFL